MDKYFDVVVVDAATVVSGEVYTPGCREAALLYNYTPPTKSLLS